MKFGKKKVRMIDVRPLTKEDLHEMAFRDLADDGLITRPVKGCYRLTDKGVVERHKLFILLAGKEAELPWM